MPFWVILPSALARSPRLSPPQRRSGQPLQAKEHTVRKWEVDLWLIYTFCRNQKPLWIHWDFASYRRAVTSHSYLKTPVLNSSWSCGVVWLILLTTWTCHHRSSFKSKCFIKQNLYTITTLLEALDREKHLAIFEHPPNPNRLGFLPVLRSLLWSSSIAQSKQLLQSAHGESPSATSRAQRLESHDFQRSHRRRA